MIIAGVPCCLGERRGWRIRQSSLESLDNADWICYDGADGQSRKGSAATLGSAYTRPGPGHEGAADGMACGMMTCGGDGRAPHVGMSVEFPRQIE